MSKVKVILLGHKSLAGKDTFFEAVKDMGFVRVAFADKLKSTVADLYNFSHEQMYGELKDIPDERYPTGDSNFTPYYTPRRILQIFGQDQRKLFPDIWAAYVFDKEIPNLVKQGHKNIIVTDFRFKNEAVVAERWAERDLDNRVLHTVKVHRPNVYARSGSDDISEVDLDDYEFTRTVVNDSTLQEFQEKARLFVTNL